MNYAVTLLTEEHNQALLDLAATSDTGSDLFVIDRSPDFFALGRTWGESRYYGLWRRERLIGCLGVTRIDRFLAGEKTPALYLHDFRLHPAFTGTRAYFRLVHEAVKALQGESRWAYGIVWDSNSHRPSLLRGDRLFPAAAPIGQSVHLGMPLFLPLAGDWKQVEEISAGEAWKHYEQWAAPLSFAFADRERFAEGGVFLGLRSADGLLAVCKLVDQTPVRKLIASRSLPPLLRMLHAPFRLRGAIALPAKRNVFPHLYLAHYASADPRDHRPAFFAYLARRWQRRYAYAFTGLSPEEAKAYRNPLAIKLRSTTYAYGDPPRDLSLAAHEITLM